MHSFNHLMIFSPSRLTSKVVGVHFLIKELGEKPFKQLT
jgi:hypothetical protein